MLKVWCWRDDDRCSGASKPQEKEAAELAGALLVPLEAAKAHAIRGGQPEARRFDTGSASTWQLGA